MSTGVGVEESLNSSPKTGSEESGSDSVEEDRLRRLFESCDADGDGFIDG